MNLIPTVIEKSNKHDYAYDLYSKLLKERIIFCSGEIDDIKANLIIAQLIYLDSLSNEDISLYINSPGGCVTSGMAIYDTMNFINSDVKTICVGLAASMAAFLLSSGTKGKRYCLENSEVMIHQPLGGAQGQASDILISANHIIKTRDKLNKLLSENTGQELSKINKDVDRDYFMTADEACKYGIIDKVIKKRK